MILAQEAADPSNPLIELACVMLSAMIMRHRPQLEDGERPAAETRAPLTIKNRPGGVELDENRADADYRGNHGQTKQSHPKIDGALERWIDERRNDRA